MTAKIQKFKTLLAFDTSCPTLSVALHTEGSEIRKRSFSGSMKHAENLLPIIDELLKEEKMEIDDIDAFLIGRGPGSFTGLRIGYSTLKGFLAAQHRPAFGELSFDMIAENVSSENHKNLAVCLDARRDRVFLKTYKSTEQQWQSTSEPQLILKEDLLSKLQGISSVTGDALNKYSEILEKSDKKLLLQKEDLWYPKASSLIQRYRNSEKTGKLHNALKELQSPEDLLPFYFRLSQPEEMRQENANS
jgi:tRNA threonylcarbamoyladenosine biosynthesis protein TsaB